MQVNSDRALNTLLLEVQQQFLWYRERSNQRFYELEELIRVAAQKMEVLKERMLKKKKATTFVSPVAKLTNEETEDAKPLHHLKLQFPKFTEDTGAYKWLQDCEEHLNGEVINLQGCEHHLNTEPISDAAPIYDEEPVYDEEDSEVFDCEQQLADFGIGSKAQEWPNLAKPHKGTSRC